MNRGAGFPACRVATVVAFAARVAASIIEPSQPENKPPPPSSSRLTGAGGCFEPRDTILRRGNMTTERIIFSGKVQGLGFRHTVRSLARRHPLQGYVRNLPDGTVEIVAQGNIGAINGLLAELQEHFRNNIRHCERTTTTFAQSLDGFEIRF